jgi:micrococcal nuclease
LTLYVVATAVAALAAFTGAGHQARGRVSGQVVSVTDGDTFRLTTGERIRIAAIDAPEIEWDRAHCPDEIRQGLAAKRAAARLIQGQPIEFVRVGRSYKRTVALVWLRGRNLAEELMRIGAAKPWLRHAPKPDWCAR